MDKQCDQKINNSMIIRCILTILSLYFASLSKIILKNKYLILPILLIFLDLSDNIFKYGINNDNNNKCTKTFNYQSKDKIIDILSYFYTHQLFDLDKNVMYLSIYRLFGVVLFCISKLSLWLIIFVDFVKEYMTYLYVFKNNLTYFPVFFVFKIVFEMYYHLIVNKDSY
jgi:hypothetical protein